MPLTLKRKAPEADPPSQTAIPSALPPSVEEAYRRKCIQLRNRTNEVEDANDAARLRLARIRRQVEKLRIERAFLLEQLTRRTSTNVEDSDGSPSPPPTEPHFALPSESDANSRKPKDKPLRTKRGHRKSMMGEGEGKAAGASSANAQPQSPTSESFSQPPASQVKDGEVNGHSKSAKKPADAFEVYCEENRAILEAKNKDGDEDVNVEEELSQGWKDLPDAEREEYQSKFEKATEKASEPKESPAEGKDAGPDGEKSQEEEKESKEDREDREDREDKEDREDREDKEDDEDDEDKEDEDVEMTNYDSEADQEAPSGDKAD